MENMNRLVLLNDWNLEQFDFLLESETNNFHGSDIFKLFKQQNLENGRAKNHNNSQITFERWFSELTFVFFKNSFKIII